MLAALTGRPVEALVEDYAGRGYGDLKKDVADVVVEFIRPFQDRTRELLADEAELLRLMAIGAGQGARGRRPDRGRGVRAGRLRPAGAPGAAAQG